MTLLFSGWIPVALKPLTRVRGHFHPGISAMVRETISDTCGSQGAVIYSLRILRHSLLTVLKTLISGGCSCMRVNQYIMVLLLLWLKQLSEIHESY